MVKQVSVQKAQTKWIRLNFALLLMDKKTNTNNDFHMGKLIKAELTRQGRSAAWLAKQVHCSPENIYKVCKQQWVTMHLLFEISKVLNHDFFRDCSDYLSCQGMTHMGK